MCALAFSSDGKSLAVLTRRRQVLILPSTLDSETQLTTDGLSGSALALSADRKVVAFASVSGIHLHDFPSGTVRSRIKGNAGHVNTLALSPDGKRLVTGDDKHDVRVFDVAEGKEVIRLDGHKGLVSAVAFASDGKHVASASLDQSFRLWDVASGREVRRFEGHHDQVWCIRFARDGKTLASASMDHTVRLWEVATGKEIRCYRGHRFGVLAFDFAPDGRTVASVGLDGTLRLWETETGKQLHSVQVSPFAVRAVAFAPSGTSVATGDTDDQVQFWDVATGKELRPSQRERLERSSGQFSSANWSPDDRLIVTAGSDGAVRLWEAATGKELRIIGRQEDNVWSAAFTPNGRRVVSVGRRDGTIHVWDVDKSDELYPFPPRHLGGISRVAFSGDGNLMATGGGSFDPTIHLWNPRTGRHVRALSGHTGLVTSIALSADGRLLASSSYNPTLRMWNTATGEEQSFARNIKTTCQVALTRDGRLLASGNEAGIHLWDTASVRKRRTLGEGGDPPESLAFSPDGRILASGHQQRTLRLWELASGRVCAEFAGHQGTIKTAAFSSDGRRIVSASTDGTALIWDVTGLHGKRPGRLSDAELERLWKSLAADNAGTAHRAVWRLSASPDNAVPFLAARLRPAKGVDPAAIDRWIVQLDDDRFEVREKASQELRRAGDIAEPALRKVLTSRPSLEVRRRVEELLGRLDDESPSPEHVRLRRAIQALEYTGTAASRKVLETLAKGAPEARLTGDARASLRRLEQRRINNP